MQPMSPQEFENEGYLQEVNRRLLHVLGLHMQVSDDGSTLEVLADLEAPGGLVYPPGELDFHQAQAINQELAERMPIRNSLMHFSWQPPPNPLGG